MENLSGHGKFFEVPDTIKQWNWGAFWLTWIWGIFNETFVSLLALIPGVNIFMAFYLGKKGNELAWQNKKWKSEADLLKVQRKWEKAGWVILVLSTIIIILLIINHISINNLEDDIKEEVIKMIEEDEAASGFVGDDFEIINYFRGSKFIFIDTTYAIVLESKKGKYWVAIRIDENHEVTEILVSHYYLIEGYRELRVVNSRISEE